MPSPMPWNDFKRIFKSYGVSIAPGGKHFKMEKTVNGVRTVYTVPVHNNEVLFVYVKGARRRFKLTPDDGVSDESFFRR